MKLFRKERQSLEVKGISAARAMVDQADRQTSHVEITFVTPEGDKLTLEIPTRFVPGLVKELRGAYEAINQPIQWGNGAAQWNGME